MRLILILAKLLQSHHVSLLILQSALTEGEENLEEGSYGSSALCSFLLAETLLCIFLMS